MVPLITKGRSENDGDQRRRQLLPRDRLRTGKLATDFEEGAPRRTGANHGFLGNTVVTKNVWHHAAVTYDGSVFRLYLDGALDGTSPPINQPPRSDSTHTVGIGTAFHNPHRPHHAPARFQGQIDEVRIWNAARSLAQIQGAMGSEITSAPAEPARPLGPE